MSKRISKSFIDTLLSRLDIVSIIQARVSLKKAGKDYEACCPFHSEKTPSFKVSPTKQIYTCFGSCGMSGGAIDFVMKYDNLDYPEAIEKIADEIGLEVEYDSNFDSQKVQKQKKLYDVLNDVSNFYEGLLVTAEGEPAVNYLKKRGLNSQIAKNFRLGYSPKSNRLISKFPNHTETELQRAGLLGKSDNGLYDQFRDRLMFTIRDVRGRVLGFGARSLGDALPKYINSTETEVFSKRFVLYGLYETLQAVKKVEHLIIVEGYMDVIALYQNGIYGAVASLGTSLTAEHITLARKYSKKLYICFDGDGAGRKAAQRAITNILPSVTLEDEIRIVYLPEGEDPDTLVRKVGKNEFLTKLQQGDLFSEAIYQSLIANANMDFIEGRGEVISRSKQLFDNLADSTYKSILYRGFVEKTDIDVYNVPKPTDPPVNSARISHPKSAVKNQTLAKYTYQKTLVTSIIRILLEYPEFANYLTDMNILLDNEDINEEIVLLVTLIEYCQSNKQEHILLDDFSDGDKKNLLIIKNKSNLALKDGAFEVTRQQLLIECCQGYENLVNNKLRKIS